jgi:adenylyltransferase/sulfurtransferase
MGEAGERYSRQALFAGLGVDGQARLGRASAVLVGCGALGSLQADLLVRAGVGRLRLIDRDFVEPSNLQRQILFTEEDARQALPKAAAAEAHLRQVNSQVEVEGVVADLAPGNAVGLLDGFDLILDGTDNFEGRFLVNDIAVQSGRPWIYGGCVGAYGICLAMVPGETACLSCLMPDVPAPGSSPTCDTAGVIGPAAAVVASLQAGEALKILSGHPERLRKALVSLDLWQCSYQEVRVPRDPSCATCVGRTFRYLEGGEGRTSSTRLCGRNAVQVSPGRPMHCDLESLASQLSRVGKVVVNAFLVRCDLGEHQLTVFQDGRALVGGTQDQAVARTVYARYVGT